MSDTTQNSRYFVISYMTLRKSVGCLGIALPFVLAFGLMFDRYLALERWQWFVEPSISAYYHTDMRNIFVGILCAIGVFLFSYRPYTGKEFDRDIGQGIIQKILRWLGKLDDNQWGDIAGFCAVGVALFPTDDFDAPLTVVGAFHGLFAALFFLIIAYFSLRLFTRSDKTPDSMTLEKRARNQVYRTCGQIILACIAILALGKLVLSAGILSQGLQNQINDLHPLFWLEAIMVLAFGVSWLTKGEAILADKETNEEG